LNGFVECKPKGIGLLKCIFFFWGGGVTKGTEEKITSIVGKGNVVLWFGALERYLLFESRNREGEEGEKPEESLLNQPLGLLIGIRS